MRWIGFFCCEKFQCDFVAQTFALVRPVFAPSFVRQRNGPKCTQTVLNALKHQFRVQWGGSGAFVAKNSDTTLWHELLHLFGPFCTEFRKATKRSSMHPNRTKRTKTSVQGPVGWIRCIRCKKFRRDFVHELLHQFCPFCSEFHNATKRSSMHPNRTKHSKTLVQGPRDGSGLFVAKNSYTTSWHELLH